MTDSVSAVGSVKPEGFDRYFDYPESVFQLTDVASDGMIPLGIIGSFSFLATLLSTSYIAWRMIQSSKNPKDVPLYRNQLLLLIFNLLIADLFQSMSFITSFHWYAIDMILAPTGACWAQAWFLHLGDVSSGSFVMAIALHTWFKITHFGRSLSFRTFVCCVCGIWAFSILVASLGPIIRGQHDFVRAGLWCWINVKYEDDRLSLHYVWIFIYECGTIVLYAFIWIKLYKHARECRDLQMHQAIRSKIERSQKFMTVYPVIYVIFTLPLAFGRMWSMAHNGQALPDAYMVVAGCLIASCGWADALMYTITRGVFDNKKANNGSGSYSRGDTEQQHGYDYGRGSVGGLGARDRIHGFDDTTALRTMTGDGDGTTTTTDNKTTTVVIGGKDVDMHFDGGYSSPTPKSHRILGINRNTSNSRPSLGRLSVLIDDEKDLIRSPTPTYDRAGANSNRISPTPPRADDNNSNNNSNNTGAAAYAGRLFSRVHSRSQSRSQSRSRSRNHSSRAASPSGSEETRVPSNGSDGNGPPVEPASIPFGHIKKETTIATTHTIV